MVDDCVFCKIVRKEIPAKIVYDDKNFIGILDINPKAEGHTVIICKKHYKNILEMPASLGNELVDAIKTVSLNLVNKKNGEGFNVVFNTEAVAGQSIFHVHCHIIPRKKSNGLHGIV